jgi:hypothetical protein
MIARVRRLTGAKREPRSDYTNANAPRERFAGMLDRFVGRRSGGVSKQQLEDRIAIRDRH